MAEETKPKRQRRRKGELAGTVPLFARVRADVYLAINKLAGDGPLHEGLEKLLRLAHIKDSDSTI
jgi:hypothetical protein